jgi:outer membrane protein assembly factor BamA
VSRSRARSFSALFALFAVASISPSARPAPLEGAEACKDASAVRVDRIAIEGLDRTLPYVVRRELPFHEGERVPLGAWRLAETRLWNLGIFSRVELRVEARARTCVAVIELEERFTLNPLLRYAFGGRALYFAAGLEEDDLFGRYLFASALYEYFDGFHGGELTFKEPRLFDRREELIVQVGRRVRPRPGFADARAGARVEVAASSDDDVVRAALRLDGFGDRFLDPLEGERRFPPADTESLEVTPLFRVGRVDTLRIRQRGASLELRPTFAKLWSDAEGDAPGYAAVNGEALFFALAGTRWNFAARLRAGVVGRVPPHLELYAGGLDLLRGYPDNHLRARALGVANVELRFTAFDSKWLALVPAVFVDGAAARTDLGRRTGDLSTGAGVRLLVPKLVDTGLRFDVALPVTSDDPLRPQPSFGVFQFFYSGMPVDRW